MVRGDDNSAILKVQGLIAGIAGQMQDIVDANAEGPMAEPKGRAKQIPLRERLVESWQGLVRTPLPPLSLVPHAPPDMGLVRLVDGKFTVVDNRPSEEPKGLTKRCTGAPLAAPHILTQSLSRRLVA